MTAITTSANSLKTSISDRSSLGLPSMSIVEEDDYFAIPPPMLPPQRSLGSAELDGLASGRTVMSHGLSGSRDPLSTTITSALVPIGAAASDSGRVPVVGARHGNDHNRENWV